MRHWLVILSWASILLMSSETAAHMRAATQATAGAVRGLRQITQRMPERAAPQMQKIQEVQEISAIEQRRPLADSAPVWPFDLPGL